MLMIVMPLAAVSGELDAMGPDSPKAVRCGDIVFELTDEPSLRFGYTHFQSQEKQGPFKTKISCGHFPAPPDQAQGWICATDEYTPRGVVSGTKLCPVVEELMRRQDVAARLDEEQAEKDSQE